MANHKGQLVVVETGARATGQLAAGAIVWIQAADTISYVVWDATAEELLWKLNPRGAESIMRAVTNCVRRRAPKRSPWRAQPYPDRGGWTVRRRIRTALSPEPAESVARSSPCPACCS